MLNFGADHFLRPFALATGRGTFGSQFYSSTAAAAGVHFTAAKPQQLTRASGNGKTPGEHK